MGDTFTWRATVSGAWNTAANWTDTTTSASPALAAPGAADTATIAGPTGNATYFAVTGPGSAASFTATGNVGLGGGAFTFGALADGSAAASALLDIGPGTSVTAASASFFYNPVVVNGAGAALTVTTPASFSGNIDARDGASITLAGLSFVSFSSLAADSTATVEIGPGGGPAPEVGAITIDAGVTVAGPATGEGTFVGSLVNNGTVTIGGGTGTEFMVFAGPVTGSGSVLIASGGGVVFDASDSAPIVFTGTTGLVNFEPGTIGFVGGISAGVISGFGAGNTLTFSGATFDTASYAPTSPGMGNVTLAENGTSVGTLTVAGTYTGATTLLTLPDIFGDTQLELAAGSTGAGGAGPSGGTSSTDSFVWVPAAGGDWGTASNWLDNSVAATVAPGAKDVVTINGSSTAYQVVRGQGNSLSLITSGDVALGGAFTTGGVTIGNTSVVGNLVLTPAASVIASSVSVENLSGTLSVSDATLAISGALFDGGSMVVVNQSKVTAASLSMQSVYGVSVDATSNVDIGGIGGTTGFLTVEQGASIIGYGSITASIIDNGVITASASSIQINGPVTGTGTLFVGGVSSPLTLNGSVAATNTITFGSQSGTLRITGAIPSAGISGFAISDVIQFGSLTFDSVTYTPSGGNGTLALLSDGSQVGSLTLLGALPAATSFIATPFNSGTDLMLASGTLGAGANPPSAGTASTDVYQWKATVGGDWGAVANWTDTSAGSTTVAPGVNDTVTIAGFGGSFDAISGQGNAATLNTSGELALGGIFQVGSLNVASQATVVVTSGATLTTGSATINGRSLDVTGAGARLDSPGTLLFGNFGTVNVMGGGTIDAIGMTTTGDAFVNLDNASAIEVGSAADATAGSLVVDSGATLNGGFIIGAPVIDNGIITVGSAELLELNGPVTGDGTIVIGSGGQLYLSSSVGPNVTIEFADATGVLSLSNRPEGFEQLAQGAVAGGVAAQIVDYTAGDSILIDNNPVDTAAFTPSGPGAGTLTIGDNGSAAYALNLLGDYTAESFIAAPSFNGAEVLMAVECFAAGTRLMIPGGEVAVEDLSVGDLVRARSLGDTPITWIGWREVDCRRHPEPRRVWPVRVRAGAFGDNVPHRDLLLSPDHAVLQQGVLIPIKHLIDGDGVAQVPVDTVTYYHIELARHDVLLAEGLPAESWLDVGERSNFANGGSLIALHPDFSAVRRERLREATGYAPLVVAGAAVVAARQSLAARAMSRGGRRMEVGRSPRLAV